MIGAVEDWLIAELERLLGSRFRSIESGPGDWSDGYFKRLASVAPAIRVVWQDASARPESELTLDTLWNVYFITGWSGGGNQGRRRGQVGQIGAFRAIELAAPILHDALIPDVGRIRVSGISDLWTEDFEKAGIAVYGLTLAIPIQLDPELDESAFDDFLRAGAEWELPPADGADAEQTIELPREET